ncbi:MAG: hypothetical protein LBN33_00535 [Desulfovibrio sp.]|nr:hypothetical protein [Desulfovibrio sp.]
MRLILLLALLVCSASGVPTPSPAAPESETRMLLAQAQGTGDILAAGPDALPLLDPVLTIFYNASSLGEMQPCPTCGRTPNTYGGLARRIGLFREYRRLGKACLVIAGAYEFLADDSLRFGHLADEGKQNTLPGPAEAARALQLHELLRVDAGWLSAKAAGWMRSGAGKIPGGYTVLDKKASSRLLDSPAGPLGIVFFPEGPVPGKGPGPGQEEAVLAAGRDLRGKTGLLIGVSPWGLVAEKKFLPKAEGLFDCILGGGEGVGFDFAFAEDKSSTPLWLRPDVKGRAVNVLEIYKSPLRNAAYAWNEGKTFNAWLDFMGEGVPEDRRALEIIGQGR